VLRVLNRTPLNMVSEKAASALSKGVSWAINDAQSGSTAF
jgi:hypothetical protein